MYYQNYEDYMRMLLGYPVENNYYMDQTPTYINENEMQMLYPQVYKLINPIVCNTCDGFSGKLTEENLENMVEDVYKKIESNNEIISIINVENNVQNRNSEDRQSRRRNPLLRDLIKILILNRLLGGFFPNRPPQRPPYPGPRPPQGGPGGRPPFPPTRPQMPRDGVYGNF